MAVARASKPIIAAVALFAILVGPLVAGPLEDAEDAFRAGDKAKGLRLNRIAAEQGTAEAQYRLGLFFSNGQGVPQDYAQRLAGFALPLNRGIMKHKRVLVPLISLDWVSPKFMSRRTSGPTLQYLALQTT